MERTNARKDPLHAQAQLCRQLQQLATHFPLQNQKYARNTPLNALRRSISFALPSRDFASLSAVCNEIALLKTKHFTPRLLTTGLHVRILTGEPVRFCEHLRPGECLESTKRMQIESDTPYKEAPMHVQLFNSRFSREKAHINAHILRLS